MDQQSKFNRLALAAALLEYDNDPQDKYGDNVDHRRSAMFRNLNPPRPPALPPIQVDSRTQDHGRPESYNSGERRAHSRNRSALSSQFSHPSDHGTDPDDLDDLNVDRWALPEHMLSRERQSVGMGNLADTRRKVHTRTVSFSNSPISPGVGARSIHLERLGDDDDEYQEAPGPRQSHDGQQAYDVRQSQSYDRRPSYDARQSYDGRPSLNPRHSYDARDGRRGSYDAARDSERVRRGGDEGGQRRSSVIGSLNVDDTWRADNWRADGPRPNPIMVPLPDSPAHAGFAGRPLSSFSARSAGRRGSIPSPAEAEFQEEEILSNPFELPAPPPEMGSRFDPKALDAQRRSMNLSRNSTGSRPTSSVFDDTPQLERRASLIYSDTPRRSSIASMDDGGTESGSIILPHGRVPSRIFDDIPMAQDYGKALRPSKYQPHALRVARHELLRPKTLIMPGVLEGSDKQKISVHVPDGFSLGEKPLPADARASILNMGLGVPMSLSQRTFRNSLMVGGRRDDEALFPGQAEEGEIYGHGADDEPEEEEEAVRKPGKLYGTSLIDQLEARKSQLHNKQRVFYGDGRPNMMARNSSDNRRSTLIDANTLNDAPTSPTHGAPGDGGSPDRFGARPISYAPSMPQLNVPDESGFSPAKNNSRLAKSRSVFGVDTVWEREMAKLKTIQDAEQQVKDVEDAKIREKERLKARRKAEKEAKRRSMFAKSGLYENELDEDGNVISETEYRQSMIDPRLSRMDHETMTDPLMSFADPRMSMIDPMEAIDLQPGRRMSNPRLSTMYPETPTYDQYAQSLSSPTGDEDLTREKADERPPTLLFEPGESGDLNIMPAEPQAPPERRPGSRLGVDDWFQSSDEDSDDGTPRRRRKSKAPAAAQEAITSPTSQRSYASPASQRAPPPQLPRRVMASGSEDSSDEEDVPLSRVRAKVNVESSDEEVPLSQLRKGGAAGTIKSVTKKTSAPALPSIITDMSSLSFMPQQDAAASAPPAVTVAPADGGDDDDDEPLFIRRERNRASAAIDAPDRTGSAVTGQQSVEEIEDDLPLGWKHAKAMNRPPPSTEGFIGPITGQRAPQPRASIPQMPSFYGQPPMSGYGMGGMGMPSPYMSMPMGMPMAPPMMMPGGGGMMPGGGVPPGMPFPPFEAPDPGRNIDDWRKQVAPLAPAATGSATVSSHGA